MLIPYINSAPYSVSLAGNLYRFALKGFITFNIQKNGVTQANTSVYISQLDTSYTTDSSGNITLTGEVGNTTTYTFYLENMMYRSSDILVSFSSIGSVITVNTSLITYTVVLAGTDTSHQKLTMVYNGTTYTNSANITVPIHTSLSFSSTTVIPWYNSGLIYINGTNTGARKYTITSLTGNITVTNAGLSLYGLL